jgi:hypothetical protein
MKNWLDKYDPPKKQKAVSDNTNNKSIIVKDPIIARSTVKQSNSSVEPVDNRHWQNDRVAKERAATAEDFITKLTTIGQYSPEPISRSTSIALNSALGLTNAYYADKEGDEVNRNINLIGAAPVPGYKAMKMLGSGLGNKLQGKATRAALMVAGIDLFGTGADLTNNYGLQKKKNGGWLNKYASGGNLESTMGGLTDKGFNYNGAWGGTMAIGGSLPGATGMMYARTGAPSNGPYAKKTLASAQNGEEITPIQFYNDYLNSPNYINRLKLQGYKDPKKTISDRLNNLNKTKVTNVKGLGNVYRPDRNNINLDSEEQKKYNLNPLSTKVHEYSHAAGSLGHYLTPPEKIKNTTLNRKEINLIDRGNKFWNLYLDDRKKYSIDKAMEIEHDRLASEVKADMDVLRYNLKKDKIYDTGTQNFNQEYLNKSKNKYKTNKVINRLFDRYSDKDLINLMNTIAKNDGNDDISFAQNGIFSGKFSKFKKSLPPNLALTPNSHYDLRYGWKHSGKPKDFNEAISMEDPMFSLEDDGTYHGMSVQGNTGRFLKPKNHPSLKMELDWYYGDSPEAIEFRGTHDLNKKGRYYKYVPKSQNGAEMKYYQEGLDFKPKTISEDGAEIPFDSMGYWNPENWGKPVNIPSTEITMEGVDQPLIGISDTGDIQFMEPGEDYEFDGNYVTEYPVARGGISVNQADAQPVKKLDQSLNFTNYNKPTKGGWLDKYN